MKNNLPIKLLLILLLNGCAINNVPPADIYTLSPQWNNILDKANNLKQSPQVLKIAPIRATQALISDEIFYSNTQHVQNSYVYSRWNNTPVKLLQTLFQVSLEKNQLFKAVIPPTSISKADLLLESILLELHHQIKNDGSSDGIIRMHFYLIRIADRSIIASKEFVSKVPTQTTNAKGAVEALNKAASNISKDLVSWLAMSCTL